MTEQNTPQGVQEGDRIRLVAPMLDDPAPIKVGEEGIVTWINHVGMSQIGLSEWQIGVEWVSGRSLMLAVPPDRFEIVRPDTCKFCKQDIWPTGRDEDGAEWMNSEGEVVCGRSASDCVDPLCTNQPHRHGTLRYGFPHEPMTIDDEIKENLDAGVIVVGSWEEAGAAIAAILPGLDKLAVAVSCECNGGPACACPDCTHSDCSYRDPHARLVNEWMRDVDARRSV